MPALMCLNAGMRCRHQFHVLAGWTNGCGQAIDTEFRLGDIVEGQQRVIDFLSDPAGHGGDRVETIRTHGAYIFLAGDCAIKLKRAVKFPYMDFSTIAKRQAVCEAELRLNRRTAPTLYRSVTAITEDARGGLALGGEGRVLDWVVIMDRFDQATLFDRLAESGALTVPLMESLADEIARFHASADVAADIDLPAEMRDVVHGNTANLRQWSPSAFSGAAVDRLDAACAAKIETHRDLLRRRAGGGFVRRCHGDLHLRNVCLVEGVPTLFDCLEFSERLATIDVAYDLAFLLMDLEHRGLRWASNRVLNRYLARTADYACLPLLPLYMSVRAAVRAHVSAAADQCDEACAYFRLALGLLDPVPPRLVAVGGLSGSGKSTLAAALAPAFGRAPGAVILRSDVLRKQLAEVDLFETLPPDAYTQDQSDAVYTRLGECCRSALAAGFAAVADAVFGRDAERQAIADVAAVVDVPFQGLWLEIAAEEQQRRLAARTADVSDATPSVGKRQRAMADPVRDWDRIDAGRNPQEALAAAQTVVLRRG